MYDELEMAHITKSIEENLTISGETDPKVEKEGEIGMETKPKEEESKVEETKEEIVESSKEEKETEETKEIKETLVIKEKKETD
jgi:hypothetical protein